MLRKIAIDRIVKEYRKGNLSSDALKKLQQNGMIRPIDRYIDGINRGTNKILDRNAGQETISDFLDSPTKTRRIPIEVASEPEDVKLAFSGGGYVNENNKRILKADPNKFSHRLASPFLSAFNKKESQLMDAIITRHEALEEIYGTKNNQKILAFRREIDSLNNKEFPSFVERLRSISQASKKNMLNKGLMFQEVKPSRFRFLNKARGIYEANGKYYKNVGVHNDPRVLTGEADLVSKIPYPEYTEKIKRIRNKTGERQYLTKVLGQDPYTKGLPSRTNKLLMSGKNLNTIKIPYVAKPSLGIIKNDPVPEMQFHVVDKPKSKISNLLAKMKGMFR